MPIGAIIRIIDTILQALKYAFGLIDSMSFQKEMTRINEAVKKAGEGTLPERVAGGQAMENGFNKNVKKGLVLIFLLPIIHGCNAPDAPQMDSKVTYWSGAPEREGICTDKTGNPELDGYLTDLQDIVCINAKNEAFKKYGCMTHEDMGKIQKYIETLLYTCKKWK